MQIRLQKILAQAGIASRRKAEEYILSGMVAVDNKVVTAIGTKIDPSINRVTVNRKPVKLQNKVYVLMNKPKGYLCTSCDTHDRPTVFDLLPGIKEKIFTAGRLDKDTEGMLILTNDGDFSNRLLHPSFNVKKTYKAVLDKILDPKDRKRLEKGIFVDGSRTHPCSITPVKNAVQVLITIHEGRKRQVRRMFEVLRYYVLDLKRIKIGRLTLGSLRKGEYKFLSKHEIKLLLE